MSFHATPSSRNSALSKFGTLRACLLAVCMSAVMLLIAAGCARNTPPEPISPVVTASPATPQLIEPNGDGKPAMGATPSPGSPTRPDILAAADFVGDRACSPCHAKEFRDHQASYHALTLRLADRASLGRMAPHSGALPGNIARVEQEGDGYRVVIPGAKSVAGPLQYALGSGKSGLTFVTLMGDQLFEMRASYFPHLGKWRVTPGQEKMTRRPVLGVHRDSDEARRCLGCHVTTLPVDSNVPEKRFFGVGCEACHGAGSAHIRAMNTGQAKEIHMERMRTWQAERINELCGKCHRTAATAGIEPGTPPDTSVTSRFQPYALMLSRCFQEGGKTLSCNTCHNPHQNTSHDQKTYEAACLNCHRSNGKGKAQDTTDKIQGKGENGDPEYPVSTSSGKVCPVNARTGCIGCHMPRKEVIHGADVRVLAPDHFIRVRRPAVEAKWLKELAKTPSPAMSAPTSMPMSGQ
jgi:hypothetical protein